MRNLVATRRSSWSLESSSRNRIGTATRPLSSTACSKWPLNIPAIAGFCVPHRRDEPRHASLRGTRDVRLKTSIGRSIAAKGHLRSVNQHIGVGRIARLRVLLDQEAGGELAGPLLRRPRGAGEVLAGDGDFAGPEARVAVEEMPLDLARRVVRRLVGRVGRRRAVRGTRWKLDEALLAGEEDGAGPARAAQPGGGHDGIALHPGARAVLHELHADCCLADAVDGAGARREAEAQGSEGASEDRTRVVAGATHRDLGHAVRAGRPADQVEGTLERREWRARAERGGVRGPTEGEVTRAERRRRAELASVVALGGAGAGRVALLAAGSIHDSVAAPEALLDGAGRRAAVAAGGVAVVALLGAAYDAVAAACDQRAGVAAAVTIVGVAVVASLARADDAVAAVGDALAERATASRRSSVLLLAAGSVDDSVAAA